MWMDVCAKQQLTEALVLKHFTLTTATNIQQSKRSEIVANGGQTHLLELQVCGPIRIPDIFLFLICTIGKYTKQNLNENKP